MITASLEYEKNLWNKGITRVVGIDEVGRGCFAGPVVAAAVILPHTLNKTYGITDSKLLTPKRREELDTIVKKIALEYKIITIDVDIINSQGIGQALAKAYFDLLKKMMITPQHILMDGFKIKGTVIQQTPIIKGDQKSVSIAASSIIAKVYRDGIMRQYHEEFPEYNFFENKGYGTKSHRDALKVYGLTKLHRTSFNLTKYL